MEDQGWKALLLDIVFSCTVMCHLDGTYSEKSALRQLLHHVGLVNHACVDEV